MKRPLGVSLISYFYMFGAGVMILTAIFFNANADEFGIAERFGIPNVPERIFRMIVAMGSLLIIYGYMRLKRWGFWLMIVYSLGFGVISYGLLFSHDKQPFIGNLIWSVIVLVYTLCVRRSFFTREKKYYEH
ncbi:hypothetical protein [Paenibacillus pini]|nr:hypothetical protein [Paenibacillus pini]